MKIIPFIVRALSPRAAAVETPHFQMDWQKYNARKIAAAEDIQSIHSRTLEAQFRAGDARLRKLIEEETEKELHKNLSRKEKNKSLEAPKKSKKSINK